MKLFTTLDIIGDYFMKTPQRYKFHHFCNIIIFINYNDIPSYNASGREFIEERKKKLEGKKEESHNSANLTGN